jgi:hypothetical protein
VNDSNEVNPQLGFAAGDEVIVRITERKPFGLLVKVGDPELNGVIERIGLVKAGYLFDQFNVGQSIHAVVVGLRDWSNQLELRLPPLESENGLTT